MQLVSRKSRLRGAVSIPGSKSHTIRAVAIGALAAGQSLIRRPLASADTMSAVTTYRALGATIDTSDPKLWTVEGTGGAIKVPAGPVDVGNSGTTLNIALGSAALVAKGRTITFTGDKQTQSRPVGPLLDSLTELGAKCVSVNSNGKAPATVTGQIVGGKTAIACSTSQYLSSLLLCTPLAARDSEIDVTLLNEPGYAQMTLDWLDGQGIEYRKQQMKKFHIKGKQAYEAFDRPVPADFSSATFFLCAAALVGEEVTLLGLDFSDSQPDKAVVDYLKGMGAGIDVKADAVVVEELPDGLVVQGGHPKAASVHGWGDHRIVMAMALAGLALDEPLAVDTAEAMSVTFPDYVQLMRSLGADMSTIAD
jgi:3-phosphoshikimate 1-carboxyvinyltransferase